MIAVTNTTPLRYLVALGIEELLRDLFERVLVPGAVILELTTSRTPADVSRWAQHPPAWAEVRSVRDRPRDFPSALHAGEREAILLVEDTRADILLIDEHAGRREALRRNLPAVGTLGIFEQADSLGLLQDFPKTIRDLKQAGFFISSSLEQLLLNRHLFRQGRGSLHA